MLDDLPSKMIDGQPWVPLLAANAAVAELEDEVARLRKFFERMSHDEWGFSDIDGGDFQDYAVDQGLLVQVPADEQFKAEWGSDHRYVFNWSPLATESPPE